MRKFAEARARRLRINIHDSSHTIWLKINWFIETIVVDTEVAHCGDYDPVRCYRVQYRSWRERLSQQRKMSNGSRTEILVATDIE
jgi:hypothetical protein